MAKTNKFHVKEFEQNRITVEEERKYRSTFALFFIRNGKLIFWISLLFSLTLFIIAVYFAISNIDSSSIVKYESNGVLVTFDGNDSSIINGTPITEEYASKVFNSSINSISNNVGVVIKLKERIFDDRVIIYYSDNTSLIKYNDGTFMKVSSVNGSFGVSDDGIIDANATIKSVSGSLGENQNLGITVLYLSDGSGEVIKGETTFFVRNNDITNNEYLFYTNLSGVSLPIDRDGDLIYYSDGTIKDNGNIIVNNNRYEVVDKKYIFDNIVIIYYENGYAEIIKDDLSVIVRNKDHVIYDDNSLEIIDNSIDEINIKDIMDIKEITLNNTNTESVHYIVVLEETENYDRYNISKRLSNDFIRFSVYVNGGKFENNILNNNLKNNTLLEGLDIKNNTYLLYKGSIDRLTSLNLKLGLWIDYEDITNDYMNSAFIGTIKVYIESLS